MKKTLISTILAIALTSASAWASSTVIAEYPAARFEAVGAKFHVSLKHDKAVVAVALSDNEIANLPTEYHDPRVFTHVKVAGLAYNAAAGQVVYSAGNTSVVCATVTVKHCWLGTHAVVTETGNCGLDFITNGRALELLLNTN